jgi:hypothetical protein
MREMLAKAPGHQAPGWRSVPVLPGLVQRCGGTPCSGPCPDHDEDDAEVQRLVTEPAESSLDGVAVSSPDDPAEQQAERVAQEIAPAVASREAEPAEAAPAEAEPEVGPAEGPGAAEAAEPAAGLLVEDEAAELAPGQLRRGVFLAELRAAVCATAEQSLAAVGRTADGCPYLDRWFAYYQGKDAAHIERTVRRYAPEARAATAARDYIPAACDRVRQGIETWTTTGELSGVPADLAAEVPAGGLPEAGGVAAKTRPGEAARAAAARPQAVLAQLGPGRALDPQVRGPFERALGHSFAGVRVHTDAPAAGLADRLAARAFTVGNHVAFGHGQYRPGSLIGDAILAHELAHVVQQGGAAQPAAPGPSGHDAAEEDADLAAVHAVGSVWSGGKLARVARTAIPRIRSGLRLQRCKTGPTRNCHVTSGPTYTPAGIIPVTATGGRKNAAPFTMAATFGSDPATGKTPACCEVRQYIKWDKAFHTQAAGPPHAGFPSSATFDTWYEDRDDTDTVRYGHRTGVYGTPVSGCANEYKTGATQDQANGTSFCGSDQPGGLASDVGQYQFQLKVIDTCNGDAVKASSAVITINW